MGRVGLALKAYKRKWKRNQGVIFICLKNAGKRFFWGAGGVSKIKGGFLEELPGENKEDIFQLVVGIWRWNR